MKEIVTLGVVLQRALRVWCMDMISRPHFSVEKAQKSTTWVPWRLTILMVSPFFMVAALPLPPGMMTGLEVLGASVPPSTGAETAALASNLLLL